MTEIKLTKRYPNSRTEDITDAYMRGWNDALDAVQNGKFHIAEQTEPQTERTLVDGLSAFVTRFNPFSDESLWICKTIELLEERAKQTEPRDLAQDLATGKESILSLAIKGKMERRQKRQTEPSTGVADCPWK